jgi:hypothetical protein
VFLEDGVGVMGKFAKDAFSVARDRILEAYAEKLSQALQQVGLSGNRGGYIPALTKCAGERLREEILALADAWVEEFTLRKTPCSPQANKDLAQTARQMAAGAISALRGQLDLTSKRIGIPLNEATGHINREIEKCMSSAVKEGVLRIKQQRLVAQQTSIHRTQNGRPSLNPAQAKKHDSVSSFSMNANSAPKEALHNTEPRRDQLPVLPVDYMALAKALAVQDLQHARGQWEFMLEAARRLEDCQKTDRAALEQERDWRMGNAKSHLELGAGGLFDAFAEQCWNLVSPDAERFGRLLPVLPGEVRKVIIYPELEPIVADTLSKRSAKWADQTTRQGAVTNSDLWSDLGAKFGNLARQETMELPDVPDDQRLHALGSYTRGAGKIGEWTLVGSTENLRSNFERVATHAGIALAARV